MSGERQLFPVVEKPLFRDHPLSEHALEQLEPLAAARRVHQRLDQAVELVELVARRRHNPQPLDLLVPLRSRHDLRELDQPGRRIEQHLALRVVDPHGRFWLSFSTPRADHVPRPPASMPMIEPQGTRPRRWLRGYASSTNSCSVAPTAATRGCARVAKVNVLVLDDWA